MVLPDYPLPLKESRSSTSDRSTFVGNSSDESGAFIRSSLHRSRHVSMQSIVDSFAQESHWNNNRPDSLPFSDFYNSLSRPDSMPGFSGIYTRPDYSTSFLLEQSARELNQKAIGGTSALHVPPITLAEKENTDLQIGTFHEILFVGVVVMAQFMCLAGLGQAISPVKYISAGLGVVNPGEEAWFSAAYSLTTGTFILISGRMGDIIGHKRMFVFGYLFLGVWSGFAGFSAYVGRQIFFDICRAMQGVGSAMLAPNALALLGRAYSPGLKKNLVFALFGAMAPWGFVFGALFGALFSQTAWWPWTFWSYGLASWGLSAFAVLIIPKQLSKEAQFAGQAKRPDFDWLGSILGVAGLVLVNIAWNNGPLFGWGTPHVYVILIIGFLTLVAFIWVEAYALSPLLPVSAFNGTVTYTMALIGIGWGSFGIWIYYSWRFLEEIRGQTPLSVSAEFTPALVCGLIAAGATGFMLTHTPVSFTMLLAMIAFFAGQVITAFQPVQQIYWAQMFVAILIMPFGMDMSFPAGTVILSNHMPKEHQGLAASLVNTMVNYSISIALGIAGTVEVQVNNKGATFDDTVWGIRCAWFTGVGLAGCGVVLGTVYFIRTMMKEGWKVEEV